MTKMGTHKAVVRQGLLTLQEPTDLPEGTVVELHDEDPYAYLDDDDTLDAEERAKLHASLERSMEQVKRGERGRPISDILKSL